MSGAVMVAVGLSLPVYAVADRSGDSPSALVPHTIAAAAPPVVDAVPPGPPPPDTIPRETLPADTLAVEDPEADTIPPPRVEPVEQILGYEETRRYLAGLERRPHAEEAPLKEEAEGLAIQGLVVDETLTPPGRDFFAEFYSVWQPPEGVFNYTIRIQEQPVMGIRTRVVLWIDDEMLFQLQLQPRFDMIQELARQAAAYTRQELEQRAAAGGEDAIAPR